MDVPLTNSERLTALLCERSFLRFWSYPRLFRDQGQNQTGGVGKELSDLTVICGDDIVLFSIKECVFRSTGRINVDWPRWFERTIHGSVKQLAGAERWIRNFPDRIFLDSFCRRRLPIHLPPGSSVRVHRVLVALGAASACRAFRGGAEAMRIAPDIVGDEHTNTDIAGTVAFTVGSVAPQLGWVHVLDDASLQRVLRELDTITDFVRYLRKKENLIASGRLVYAASELDLLAVYLKNLNSDEEHDFPTSACSSERVAVESGIWDKFVTSPEYRRKELANGRSYLWDSLIDKFAQNALAGTLVGTNHTLAEIETMVRIMAQEHRVSRRMLSEALGGLVAKSRPDAIARRFLMSHENQSLGYVFLAFPDNVPDGKDDREYRRQFLSDCCLVLGWRNRQLRKIVGVATEAGSSRPFRSEDLALFVSPEQWPSEMEADAADASRTLGILRPDVTNIQHWHDDEYRMGPTPSPAKDEWRNKLEKLLSHGHKPS